MPKPDTKTILLLSGNSTQNQYLKTALQNLIAPVRFIVASTTEAIQDMVTDAGKFGFKPDLTIMDLDLHTGLNTNLPGLVFKAFGGPGKRMLLLTKAADPRGPLFALLYSFRPVQKPSDPAAYFKLLKSAIPASMLSPEYIGNA